MERMTTTYQVTANVFDDDRTMTVMTKEYSAVGDESSMLETIHCFYEMFGCTSVHPKDFVKDGVSMTDTIKICNALCDNVKIVYVDIKTSIYRHIDIYPYVTLKEETNCKVEERLVEALPKEKVPSNTPGSFIAILCKDSVFVVRRKLSDKDLTSKSRVCIPDRVAREFFNACEHYGYAHTMYRATDPDNFYDWETRFTNIRDYQFEQAGSLK